MGQMEQGLHTVPVVVFMLEFDCYLNTQVIHSLVSRLFSGIRNLKTQIKEKKKIEMMI